MIYNNNLHVDYLSETNIAGSLTVNPIIRWIQGIQAISEFLTLSPNGSGSVDIDLDFAGICAKTLKLVEKSYGEFKARIVGKNKLQIAAGTIYVGDKKFSIPAYNRTLGAGDSGDCMKVTIANNGGGWSASASWGVMPPVAVTDTTLVIPICKAVKSGKTWQAWQCQLGSVVIPFPPACMIDGYDKNEAQSLDHNKGTLQWTTYKICKKDSGA